MAHRDPDTSRHLGWTVTHSVGKEGAILSDVDHDFHSFLRHISLARCYAKIEGGGAERLHAFDLGDDAMEDDPAVIYSYAEEPSPDVDYTVGFRLSTPFEASDLDGSGQTLKGRQNFAFTAASNTPRHETTGSAVAGRFYPTIDFEVDKPTGDEAITSLRFDFVIEPSVYAGGRRSPITTEAAAKLLLPELGPRWGEVESFYSAAQEQLRRLEELKQSSISQAGLFTDREGAVLPTRMLVTLWEWTLLSAGSQVFLHAEKPLKWEVAADGLISGSTEGKWDNIHLWGKSDQGLVSTPGMPYGFHLHWKWAASITDKTSMVFGSWTPSFLKDPALAGVDAQGTPVPGGPLIDPRTPDTDLRVAVVTRETAEAFRSLTASQETEFAALFESIAPDPAVIEDGAELAVVISIVLRRPDPTSAWASMAFPHGAFFPHAHSLPDFLELSLAMAQAYSPQYLQDEPRTRQWRRNPI